MRSDGCPPWVFIMINSDGLGVSVRLFRSRIRRAQLVRSSIAWFHENSSGSGMVTSRNAFALLILVIRFTTARLALSPILACDAPFLLYTGNRFS